MNRWLLALAFGLGFHLGRLDRPVPDLKPADIGLRICLRPGSTAP